MLTAGTVTAFDIMGYFNSQVLNVFRPKPEICVSPSDGHVLRLHYKFTFWIMVTGFAIVYYNWFHRDVITCVTGYNADLVFRLDLLNICLSYTYTLGENGKKNFLLYYRWIPYVFLFTAVFYYIPRSLSKSSENTKARSLFRAIAPGRANYEEDAENNCVEAVCRYMIHNVRTHNKIFYNYLTWNVIALIIDILAFYTFNWLLLGQFATMGYDAYPYHRDGKDHQDVISRIFSPFVDCTIASEQELVGERVEAAGCHLTVMELYEKLFFFLWFWLIGVMIITVVYIMFLCCFFVPRFRMWILRFSKPHIATDGVRSTIHAAGKHCDIGDWFMLYKMREHFSSAGYYMLLSRLADDSYRREYLKSINIDLPVYKKDTGTRSSSTSSILID